MGEGRGGVMRQKEVDKKGAVDLTCFTCPQLELSVSPPWAQALVLALLPTTYVTLSPPGICFFN